MKQRKEKRCPLKKDIRNFIDIIPLTFNRVNKLLIDKVSNVHFPDKNCERELEVVHGEDDGLLLPLPGGEAQLPVDETCLNIKILPCSTIQY